MASIDSREIIDNIIANNGWYTTAQGEKYHVRCLRITQYTNVWGKTTYGCAFSLYELNKYQFANEYVRNPTIIWDAETADNLAEGEDGN